MTNEEFYNYMMGKLENNLNLAKEDKENLGAPTKIDAIEMATRCVKGDKQHMVDFRNNPNFKNDLMTRVMQTVKDCGLDSYEYKNDMLKAVKYCPEVAIEYVPDRFKEDPVFLLEALKANPEVAELKVVKDFQAENPGFAKQVAKIQAEREQTPREVKEGELSELQGKDAELTGEISRARDELGLDGKETSRND